MSRCIKRWILCQSLLIGSVIGGVGVAKFTPHNEPIIWLTQPKPNLLLLLDRQAMLNEVRVTVPAGFLYDNASGISPATTVTKGEAIQLVYQRIMEQYGDVVNVGIYQMAERSVHNAQQTGIAYDFSDLLVQPVSDISGDEALQASIQRLKAVQFDLHDQAPIFTLYEAYKYMMGTWPHPSRPLKDYEYTKENYRIQPRLKAIDELGEVSFFEPDPNISPMEYVCQRARVSYIAPEMTPIERSPLTESGLITVNRTDGAFNVRFDNALQSDGPYCTDSACKQVSPSVAHFREGEASATGMRLSLNTHFSRAGVPHSVWVRQPLRYARQRLLVGNMNDRLGNRWAWSDDSSYPILATIDYGGFYFGPIDVPHYNKISWIISGSPYALSPILDSHNRRIEGMKEVAKVVQHGSDQGYAFLDMNERLAAGTTSDGGPSVGGISRAYNSSHYMMATEDVGALYDRYKTWMDYILLGKINRGQVVIDQAVGELNEGRPDPYDNGEEITTFAVDGNVSYLPYYSPRLWTGDISAYSETRVADYLEPAWRASKRIRYNQGRFFTTGANGGGDQTLTASLFGNGATVAMFEWLIGDMRYNPALRQRNSPLGDIINSPLVYTARDHLYINIERVGDRELYLNYLAFKNRYFKNNLLIVGSNDGLLNMIIAEKNSKGHAGERRASFFPRMFINDLPEITKPIDQGFVHQYRVDGPTNLFDARVGNGFKTIGITGMGAGGRGLIGYQLFATKGEITQGGKAFNADNEIRANFEITSKTDGFGNLGYTYSEFAYLNVGERNDGYAIAIFGNGFGGEGRNDPSTLYIINAVTGELYHEITLPGGKGGAATPALVVERDEISGLQSLSRIYVGDYSGKLYRITFPVVKRGRSIGEQWRESEVTMLFDANTDGVSQQWPFPQAPRPITIAPLLAKAERGNDIWLYFGTGMMADMREQRSLRSKVLHHFYALRDSGSGMIDLSQLQEKALFFVFDWNYGIRNVGSANGDKGWYLPLTWNDGRESGSIPRNGQRVIAKPAMLDGRAISFNTIGIVEGDSSSRNYCLPDVVWSGNFALDRSTGEPMMLALKNVRPPYIEIAGRGAPNFLGDLITYNKSSVDNPLGNINSGFGYRQLSDGEKAKFFPGSNIETDSRIMEQPMETDALIHMTTDGLGATSEINWMGNGPGRYILKPGNKQRPTRAPQRIYLKTLN